MRFLQDHHNHRLMLREARFGVCLLSLLTLSLLAGCGGGGGGNGNSGGGTTTTGTTSTGTNTGSNTVGTSTGTNTGGTTPLSISAVTATGLTATLTEASSTVSVNGTLVYTMTLTNTTTAAIPVNAINIPVTTPAAALTVIGPTGNVSFAPIPYAPNSNNGTLAPGQSISTTQTADGFTTAGTYSATATFGDDTTGPKSVGPLLVTAR